MYVVIRTPKVGTSLFLMMAKATSVQVPISAEKIVWKELSSSSMESDET